MATKRPTLAQLREWLNDIILKDPIAQREDPVEDVFVFECHHLVGQRATIQWRMGGK